MRPGDAVQVRLIWASQGALRPPLTRWADGYDYVRTEGDQVIVTPKTGLFAGVPIRYRADDVRRAST